MRTKPRQSGLSLMEEVVVVAAVALLVVFGLPALRALFRSLEAEGGSKSMISAALSTARAIAAREQRYAGVRFQNRYQQDGKGCQYMIFIVYEEPRKMDNLKNGFRAVKGYEPIKLSDSVGVMDLKLGSTNQIVDGDNRINDDWEVADTTTFSIIFSPSGRLVTHDVQVRNRDGIPDSPGEFGNPSKDDVFNKKDEVDNGIGMFYQDDYAAQDSRLRYFPQNLGFGEEPSRNSFIIYDRTIFENLAPLSRYTDYLRNLAVKEVVYINPYTGTMIEK